MCGCGDVLRFYGSGQSSQVLTQECPSPNKAMHQSHMYAHNPSTAHVRANKQGSRSSSYSHDTHTTLTRDAVHTSLFLCLVLGIKLVIGLLLLYFGLVITYNEGPFSDPSHP